MMEQCKNGHDYDEFNTTYYDSGNGTRQRRCLACRRNANRAYRARETAKRGDKPKVDEGPPPFLVASEPPICPRCGEGVYYEGQSTEVLLDQRGNSPHNCSMFTGGVLTSLVGR